MNPTIRPFKFSLFFILLTLLAPSGSAQNLTKYRDFEFGMSVGAVAKQTEADPGSARTVHATPELVQTLQWNRRDYFSSSPKTDSVRSIRFDFYNDQLFKIVATYGAKELAGMTAPDLIEAISKVYGPASSPDETIAVKSGPGYEDRQKVLARWENDAISYSLFLSSSGGEFGLIALSKTLDGKATLSVREGERLDALAAPGLEIERQQKLVNDRRILEEKARSVNVSNFRP